MTHSTHLYLRLWRWTFGKGNIQTRDQMGFVYLMMHSTHLYLRLWRRTFGKGNIQTNE